MIGDPVVGRVRAVRHDDSLDQRMRPRAYAAIADDENLQAVPSGDLLHLSLHRAGIGIDVDIKHMCRIPGAIGIAMVRGLTG